MTVCVLNHKDKFPKFIKGNLIKQLGYGTFFVKINDRLKTYHKHRIYVPLETFQNGTFNDIIASEDESSNRDEGKQEPNHINQRISQRIKFKPKWFKDVQNIQRFLDKEVEVVFL